MLSLPVLYLSLSTHLRVFSLWFSDIVEGKEDGGKQRERNIHVKEIQWWIVSCMHPDLGPGVELSTQVYALDCVPSFCGPMCPFILRANALTTEPNWPGPSSVRANHGYQQVYQWAVHCPSLQGSSLHIQRSWIFARNPWVWSPNFLETLWSHSLRNSISSLSSTTG